LIQALAQALLSGEKELKIKVAAQTGKAADRLAQMIAPNERLNVESLTLHRLLSLQPGRNRLFEHRKIAADLIVVDEASMIDASLFAHLLAAIPCGARLVLLGDAGQLPPIDGGGIFAVLAEREGVHLEVCHRTKEEAIHQIYEAARIGNVNPLYTILEPYPKDFIEWIGPQFGCAIFKDRPIPQDLIVLFDRLRLICPLRKGSLGVDAINAALFRRLQNLLIPFQWWAVPILITENDASRRIFNGSSGVVLGVYRGQPMLTGREEAFLADGRSFTLNQLPGYELAFALSVHKSQGSEFENVICCLPPGSEEFGREALYTALTRAKRSVRLIGDRPVLERMIAGITRQENGIQERMEAICKFRS
jgi:exodeoxyribonuclease V alpha subunit